MLHVMYKNPGRAGCPPNLVISQYSCSVLVLSSKKEIANLRGKDEYGLGDFVMAMDEMSKKMTEDLTGKPYEPGDLGIELDKRVKSSVASFAGKDEYELGDLTRTIAAHVMNRVEENSRANHMNSVIFRERWKNTENNRTSADTIVELGKGS